MLDGSEDNRPLAIDLFCGLGGWTEGLMAEGWRVVGFDIERHQYGDHKYPAQLVIQDVLTIHGSQFKTADLIVASPPCQEYSYMAMPWSRAKKIAAEYRSGQRDVKQLTALFDACFRIQREACEAAGRHIPLVVENVRGAISWVGRSKWNYGSFHLWGDVPALMPMRIKNEGQKVPGNNAGRLWSERRIQRLGDAMKYDNGRRTAPGNGVRFTSRDCGIEAAIGRKGVGSGAAWFDQNLCVFSSKSNNRKFSSAMIAKIPDILSRHVAKVFKPERAQYAG